MTEFDAEAGKRRCAPTLAVATVAGKDPAVVA